VIIHVVSSGKLGIRLITTASRCLSLVHMLSYRMAELSSLSSTLDVCPF